MGNYGALYVIFFDQALEVIDGGNPVKAISARGKMKLSRIGTGSFTAYVDRNASPTYEARGMEEGNIALVYIYDAIATTTLQVATFTIDKLTYRTASDGRSVVTAQGQELLGELTGLTHSVDIGGTFATTLSASASAGATELSLTTIGDEETTVKIAATANDERIYIVDKTGFADGTLVAIEMDNDEVHMSVCFGVGTEGSDDYLDLDDPITYAAGIGSIVSIPEIFDDDSIKVTLDSGTHYSRIDGSPVPNKVILRDAIPSAATSGNAVVVISSQVPTSTDVTDIMTPATDWEWDLDTSAAGSPGDGGTGLGTSHKCNGANIIRLLIATADATGEWFRQEYTAYPSTPVLPPTRDLSWRSGADASGITLVMPTKAEVESRYTDPDYGVIHSIERESRWDVVTEIVPMGYDDSFTLADATEGDQGSLTAYSGFSQYFTRGEWVIVNDAAGLADWKIRKYVQFSGIRAISSSTAAKTSAADALQAQAVFYLQNHDTPRYYYKVTCVLHAEILVGQSLTYVYSVDAPNWASESTTLYVSEVQHRVDSKGVRFTDLVLTDTYPSTDVSFAERLVSKVASGTTPAGGASSGGGSGGTGTSDHGALTGLADDDHAQYALLAGRNGDVFIVDHVRAFDEAGLKLYDDGGNGIFVEDGGFVGIGTDNPINKLHIYNSAGSAFVRVMSDEATSSDVGMIIGTDTNTDRYLIYSDHSENEGLRIYSNEASDTILFYEPAQKRIGIGTTTPSTRLHVLGKNAADVQMLVQGASGQSANLTNWRNNAGTLLANVTSAGYLYTPQVRALDGNGLKLYEDGGSGIFIEDGGNVGIATNDPSYKLHLVGNAGFDGDLTFVGAQTINNTTGNLTITATSNLYFNASGGYIYPDADLYFVGAQTIGTTADNLTIAPAADLILDPVGDNVLYPTSVDQSGQNWVSGFLGDEWGIDTGLGHIDARSAYFDELRVTLFSADETLVLAGSHMVSPGMGKLSRDFTLPAVGATGSIWFRDSDALPDAAIFKEGSWVMIRVKSTDASGLTIAMVWGTVENYVDGTSGTEGEQLWTWTTKSLGAVWDIGSPPEGTASQVIPAESVAIGFGKSGDGWVMTTVNDLTSGPYMSINTWGGANPYTAANRTQHVRLGDLNGISGIGHEYGLYAGVSPSGPRIVATDTQVALHQIPLSLYSGTPEDGRIVIYALQLVQDGTSDKLPNGDVSQTNVVSTAGTFYTEIDEDPNASNAANFIYNTLSKNASAWFNLADIDHTLTFLELEAHINPVGFTDDVCTLTAQIFKTDETTALTEAIKVANQDTSAGVVSIPFDEVDTTASDADWANAKLYLQWIYHVSGGNEVIKLEPNMEVGPYIAVGYPLPTQIFGEETTGLWVGRDPDDGVYKFRIGGGNDDTDAAALTYSDEGLKLWASDNHTTPVITLDNSGNSQFTGVMTIGTSGAIVATHTQFDDDGLWIKARNFADFPTVETNRIKFYGDTTATELGSIHAHYATGESTGQLYMQFGDAWITINESAGIDVNDNAQGAFVRGGLVVGEPPLLFGGYGTPASGQIVAAQGAGDGSAISITSSDVSGMTTQAMDSDSTYFQIQKTNATTGGAYLMGASETTDGITLRGSANTADTTEATTSVAPVSLRAFVDATALNADDNAVVMRNGTTTRWILKGDGEVYSDYATSMTAYDDHDDMALIGAVANTLGGAVIQSEWDDFVTYNRDDLERLDIVTKTGFVNEHNLNKLFIGVIRQLNNRLSELEAKVSG